MFLKNGMNPMKLNVSMVAQCTFSAYAMGACHTMRLVYKKPLRQTEGFVNSLLELMESTLKSANYS